MGGVAAVAFAQARDRAASPRKSAAPQDPIPADRHVKTPRQLEAASLAGRERRASRRWSPTRCTGRKFPPPPAEYTVAAIPGVDRRGSEVDEGVEVSGNNADGILADRMAICYAQNHNSAVVKLDKSGKASTVYRTPHGGALSQEQERRPLIVERGLRQNVSQLAPQRRVFADKLPNGDPLDCLGGVINDLTPTATAVCTSRWEVCFHSDPRAIVTRYDDPPSGQTAWFSPG
jgi:hypothetical protein